MEQPIDIIPGFIQINSVTLTSNKTGESTNIHNIIDEINIYESLEQPFMSANFLIYDSVSLLTTFPIAGDEIIQVNAEIPHPGFDKKIEKTFKVFSIENLSVDFAQRQSSYVLRCYSQEYYNDLNKRVIKSYMDSISGMATKVFDEFLKLNTSPSFQSTQTSGQRTIAVPNLRPSQTLKFLAREAAVTDGGTSNFIFYENLDGFFFLPVEQLISKRPTDTFIFREKNTNITSLKSRNASKQKPSEFFKIDDFKIKEFLDFERMTRDGGLGNKVMFINPILHYFDDETTYNYIEDYDKFERLSYITEDGDAEPGRLTYQDGTFAQTQPEAHQRFIITNARETNSQLLEDRKYQTLSRKLASFSMLDAIVLDLTIPGDTSRRVGETIIIEFPEFGGTDDMIDELNRYLSGEYLITSLRHIYSPGSNVGYRCVLECKKNSLTRHPEDLSDAS